MSNQLSIARKVAEIWHEGQIYGKPEKDMFTYDYMRHCEQVSQLAKNYYVALMKNDRLNFGLEDVMAVGLAHDLLEDTALKPKKLYELGFSDINVRACQVLDKNNYKSDSEYYEAIVSNRLATIVKLADNTVNLTASMHSNNQKKVEKYMRHNQTLLNAYAQIVRQLSSW